MSTQEISASDALEAVAAAATDTQEPAAETAEPKVEQAPKIEVPAKDEKFASKFAALSRKEKEIKAREKAIEARKAELESSFTAKEQEVRSKYIDPEAFRADPLGSLEKLGMSFKDIAEMVLNDGKPTSDQKLTQTEKTLRAELEALKAQLQADKDAQAKQAEEAAKADFEQRLEGFKQGLVDFVNADPEAYELINAQEQHDLVFDVIQEHYNKTADENGENGVVLSYKAAADATENYLLENAKKLVQRPKIQKLLPAQQPAPKAAETGAKTLSNAHAVQASQTTEKRLSDEESKRKAAMLLKWS